MAYLINKSSMPWRWLMVFAGLSLAMLTQLAHAALPIETWTTSAGSRVMLMRATSIPMIDVAVDVNAGSRLDPADKAGLAAMTAGLLGKGLKQAGKDGASKSEAMIADELADLGAIFAGSASSDRASFYLRTLSQRSTRDQALNLFRQIMAYPDFQAVILAREQARSVAAIREAATKPDAIATRLFFETIYGRHPYGQQVTESSVSALTTQQLQDFYRQYYRADRMVISMVGDIDRHEAEQLAEQLSTALQPGMGKGWRRINEDLPKDWPVVQAPVAVEKRVAHPAAQSHVLLGLPALARDDGDFFAMLVGNYTLGGGGFVSRLMQEVREKRGLAYSAYSYFQALAQPGPLQLGLQTKQENTSQALKVTTDVLQRFVEEGPTEQELMAAKQNLIGGFPLRIDSNRKLLDQLAMIGFYDLPLNYLDRWEEAVQKVTVADVKRVFRRTVNMNQVVTVVVGAGG